MCAFAPPGRGYAYGLTIPIFIRLPPDDCLFLASRLRLLRGVASTPRLRPRVASSLVADEPLLVRPSLLLRPYPSTRAFHGVAHHRSPLLLRDAVEMLAE